MYTAIADIMLKTVRETNKKIGKKDYDGAIRDILKKYPHLMDSLDYQILMEEMLYLKSDSSSLYFIKDKQTFLAIDNVKIDKGIDLTRFVRNEIFTIALPTECGMVGGLLVYIGSFTERKEQYNKYMGVQLMASEYFKQDECSISVAYTVPNKDKNKNSYSFRTMLSATVFGDMAVAPEEKFYEMYIDSSNKAAISLDQEEKKYSRKVMQFLAKFLFYRAASPQRITEGLPTKAPMPKIHWTARNKVFSIPRTNNTEETYHSASIHVLRHERFYRGAYAHLKPGDRIIEVSDYVTNKKASDVHTIEN